MGTLISKLSRLSISDEKVENTKPFENICPDEQNLKTPKERFIADNILDPRSATIGIRRTPLVLVKVGGDTPVRPKMYLETDLDLDVTNKSDRSSIVTDPEDSDCSEHLFDVEEGPETSFNDESVRDFEVEDLAEVKNNPTITLCVLDVPSKEKVKKTYIYEDADQTPESTPIKPKGCRTPLGIVSNNSPLPSPLGKPWRGIREERLRLGLENTPPSQGPYPDVVQSAPGKVGIKRTAKKTWAGAHWALDESIVI